MKKFKKKKPEDADINVTPLLDIVFIMLIFFIVTSTFVYERGIDVTEHQQDEEQKEQPNNAKAVIVQVCQNGEVKVDNRRIDVRATRANIERKMAEQSGAVVIVEAEFQAPTENLVSVLDQIRAAKAEASISSHATQCEENKAVVGLF